MEFNIKQLKNLYEKEENITRATKTYCKVNNIEYSDSIRRTASNILNRIGAKDSSEDENTSTNQASILLFDIETSPIVARVWSLWQNGIDIKDIVRDWCVLCFSAKWLFSNDVISFRLTEEELETRDDKRIVTELWNLLDKADIVIAHNAERFDVRKSNARFLKYELNLPSPYQILDTLKHARKKFNLTSNKLDYIADFLGVEGKMVTPSGMWREVEEGNYDMLITMDEYCAQDVISLEQVYLKLRPYIQPHPNIGLHIVEDVNSCPTCGSENLDWNLESVYTTNSNQYHAFRCNECKSLGRSRTSVLKAKDKRNLTVPNAR